MVLRRCGLVAQYGLILSTRHNEGINDAMT